ncbi:MAG: ATP-binding protein, partial [Caldimonas sp.]
DITERKHAKEALRVGEERYRAMFDSMDEGFCFIEVLFDAQGRADDYRFLEVNPAFENQSGLIAARGRTIRELVPQHDRHWFEIYGRVALTGESIRLIDEAKALGRWFDVYASRVGGPESRTLAVLFNDITRRRQAEDDLRRAAAELAESDRRKTEFLATLAHELRNPLAPLRNGLHVMRLADDDRVAIGKARDMMERQLGHMVHLVDDLLDVARISSGKLELRKERVTIHRLVSAAVEASLPMVDAGRHELTVQMPDESLLLDADPTRITQVVSNLLNNSAKYTPPGGRIRLSVHADGMAVVLEVVDNGLGISAEALPSVFDMFNRGSGTTDRTQGGLGIGLSIVRRLVELHGGSVSARSAGPGKGSRFEVRLPLVEAPRPAVGTTPEPAAATPPTDRPLRILLADDNVDAAESLAAILEINGHVTRVAHDGIAAVETAQAFSPDIAFIDIGMPGRNGYEVARLLKTLPGLESTLLVALTGWGGALDRSRSREAGFHAHLTKPAEPEAIEGLVQKVARARRSPSRSDGAP